MEKKEIVYCLEDIINLIEINSYSLDEPTLSFILNQIYSLKREIEND